MFTYRGSAAPLWIAVLCLISTAYSQDSPQGTDSAKTYTLAGNVLNSVTGKPIPRALVRLGQSGHSMLTGPEGDFAFDNVSPGATEIFISKPGFFRPGQPADDYLPYQAQNSPYKVDVGPETGRVQLKLAPEATISGAIEGNDAEPLERIRVTALMSRFVEGRRELTPFRATALSDEDGNFRIGGLPPGRYYLVARTGQVSRLGPVPGSDKVNETYPPVAYFPSGSDVTAAAPVDLIAGQLFEANFNLASVPAFKVAGTMLNAGGWKELNRPMFVDDIGAPLLSPERFDRQTGAFEFPAVPAGTYWLQIGGVSQDGKYFTTHRHLVVESDATDMKLPLGPGLEIPVVIQKQFTHPQNLGHCSSTTQSGVKEESDCSDWAAARVELASVDFPRRRLYSEAGPVKGPLSVRGVFAGSYSVRVIANFGGYVQSVRCGSLDLLHQPLVVPENGEVQPIEVVLRDDPATLKIEVRSDKPGQQATVLVFPDPLAASEPQFSFSTQGHEIQTSLAPGAYRIFAFDAAGALDYSSLEVLEKYSSRAASINVGANENANVVVDVIGGGD